VQSSACSECFSHLESANIINDASRRYLFFIDSQHVLVAETAPDNNGWILGRHPDKSLSSFPPCYSQSLIALPWYFYFYKFTQPVTVSSSIVHLLYTVKEKGGKPYLPPYGLWKPYRNLKSENSQDYAQELQQNFMFMNSARGFLRPNSWSNWDKSLKSFPPCYSQSPPLTDFTPSSPLSKRDLKLVCNVNIVYWKPQVRELSRLCQEISTKLYVHEFGFKIGLRLLHVQVKPLSKEIRN
jgi:hypothetical protein